MPALDLPDHPSAPYIVSCFEIKGRKFFLYG